MAYQSVNPFNGEVGAQPLPPKVGVATLELLERFGIDAHCPLDLTCCGSRMSNIGDQLNARGR